MSIDGFCREIRCCSPVQVVSFSHVPFRNRQYIATTNKGGFVKLLYRIKRYMKGSLLSPPIVPMKSLPAPAGTLGNMAAKQPREKRNLLFLPLGTVQIEIPGQSGGEKRIIYYFYARYWLIFLFYRSRGSKMFSLYRSAQKFGPFQFCEARAFFKQIVWRWTDKIQQNLFRMIVSKLTNFINSNIFSHIRLPACLHNPNRLCHYLSRSSTTIDFSCFFFPGFTTAKSRMKKAFARFFYLFLLKSALVSSFCTNSGQNMKTM